MCDTEPSSVSSRPHGFTDEEGMTPALGELMTIRGDGYEQDGGNAAVSVDKVLRHGVHSNTRRYELLH